MKTAEEILKEYVEFDDVNGNKTVELLPLTIVDAMDEYADQQSEYVQKLFTKPQEVFKPLHELYRKENPHPEGKFYIPDSTTFFKWIVNKVNEYECLRKTNHNK